MSSTQAKTVLDFWFKSPPKRSVRTDIEKAQFKEYTFVVFMTLVIFQKQDMEW